MSAGASSSGTSHKCSSWSRFNWVHQQHSAPGSTGRRPPRRKGERSDDEDSGDDAVFATNSSGVEMTSLDRKERNGRSSEQEDDFGSVDRDFMSK